jgi:hypothetical protein
MARHDHPEAVGGPTPDKPEVMLGYRPARRRILADFPDLLRALALHVIFVAESIFTAFGLLAYHAIVAGVLWIFLAGVLVVSNYYEGRPSDPWELGFLCGGGLAMILVGAGFVAGAIRFARRRWLARGRS